jgi:hypothetical protein
VPLPLHNATGTQFQLLLLLLLLPMLLPQQQLLQLTH